MEGSLSEFGTSTPHDLDIPNGPVVSNTHMAATKDGHTIAFILMKNRTELQKLLRNINVL